MNELICFPAPHIRAAGDALRLSAEFATRPIAPAPHPYAIAEEEPIGACSAGVSGVAGGATSGAVARQREVALDHVAAHLVRRPVAWNGEGNAWERKRRTRAAGE